MTKSELIEYVKRRLAAGEADPRIWAENEIEIAAAVNTALGRLGYQVMRDENLCAHLQDTYTLALNISGEGALSAASSVSGVNGVLLYESVWNGPVLDNDGRTLWPLRHYSDFLRPQPAHRGYFHLQNGRVLTRRDGAQVNSAQDVQGATSPLSFSGSYSPNSVDDVPDELDDLLIDILVGVIRGSVAKLANASAP